MRKNIKWVSRNGIGEFGDNGKAITGIGDFIERCINKWMVRYEKK